MISPESHRSLVALATAALRAKRPGQIRLWVSQHFPDVVDDLPGESASKNELLFGLCGVVLRRGTQADLEQRLTALLRARTRSWLRLGLAFGVLLLLCGALLTFMLGRDSPALAPAVATPNGAGPGASTPEREPRSELCLLVDAEQQRLASNHSVVREIPLICDRPTPGLPAAPDSFVIHTLPGSPLVTLELPARLSALFGDFTDIHIAAGNTTERSLLARSLVRFALVLDGLHPELMTCLAVDPTRGDAAVFAQLVNLVSERCPQDVATDEQFLLTTCANDLKTTWQCGVTRLMYVEHHPRALDVLDQLGHLRRDFANTRLATTAGLKLARRACEDGQTELSLEQLGALERAIPEDADCPRMWLSSIASCLLNSPSLAPEEKPRLAQLEASLDGSKCRSLDRSRGEMFAYRGWRRELQGDYAAAAADYRQSYSLTRDAQHAWRWIEMALHQDDGVPTEEVCRTVIDASIQQLTSESPPHRFFVKLMRYIAAQRGCSGMAVAAEAAALIAAYSEAKVGTELVRKNDASARRLLCRIHRCKLFEALAEPIDPHRLPALKSALAPR